MTLFPSRTLNMPKTASKAAAAIAVSKAAAAIAVLSLIASNHAAAQAWALQTGSVAEDITKGLKYLVRIIGGGVIVWSVIMIWFGSKRLQDMIPFFIGAAILIAAPELLKLIPS